MEKTIQKTIAVGLLVMAFNHSAMAQFDLYYGQTNRYMFWPMEVVTQTAYTPNEQASKDIVSGGLLGIYAGDQISNPFHYLHAERDSSCTIYGFASPFAPVAEGTALTSVSAYCYDNCIWPESGSIDVFVFKITEGDSVMEVVKTATFHANRGKTPDRRLIVSDSILVDNDHFERLAVYMHEFFFDEPITITGEFMMGMMPSMGMQLGQFAYKFMSGTREDQCALGYLGVCDFKIPEMRCFWTRCNHVQGGQNTNIFPDIEDENIRTDRSQIIYPIMVPQGSVSVTEASAATAVRLTPNPARTEVTVEADSPVRAVEAVDMVGRTVLRKVFPGGESRAVLDISRLPQGCYALRVSTPQGTLTEKLVVE